ncbi:hypothetical protein PQ472_12375 (plasmid) [Lacticaseibacillus pabuli]|uniref:Uncharacterized protein n=1 Tax=Lacticaseibacillus pabuli TaxID=3025672 RepID=A0ABY7WUQ1_9LACO|nr:hypothetical protein [Lacticaseibacillus sp. KACC 23028]WDF83878.1 hypothetical protein PQ472_12375 [Lacticaseibacillus sp. KACC 23028]
MIYADKVTFYSNDENDWTWETIDQIHLNSDDSSISSGWYDKADVYDFIENQYKVIKVDIYPYPKLIGDISSNYDKFVKSENDNTASDNLVELGRNEKK